MAKNIQLSKQSTVYLPGLSSYKLVVQAINAQDMPNKIFVKQRIQNFVTGVADDSFVAVCTPTQLEDFQEDSPAQGSSFFRTSSIELVMRTPEELEAVFESLLYEVQKLVIDLDDLDKLGQAVVYTVSSDGSVISTP